MLDLFNNQKDDNDEFSNSYKTDSDFTETETKLQDASEKTSKLNKDLFKSMEDSKFDASEFDQSRMGSFGN